MVSDRFFNVKRSWRYEERQTAVLFGSVLVMAMYKDVTKVLWEGCRAGAKTFHIAGDLNVELGLLCTSDDEVEELNETNGPLYWQGCENDQGGFKKLMCYEIMKEFNCKATSIWSRCDDETEMAHYLPESRQRNKTTLTRKSASQDHLHLSTTVSTCPHEFQQFRS